MDYAYWWVSRKYNPAIKAEMAANPKLFICGHSHILKVMFDKKHNLLHMNPGLRKKVVSSGTHHVALCNRGDKIKDLEIIEIEKRV
jgi:predicted phosphodiesterase